MNVLPPISARFASAMRRCATKAEMDQVYEGMKAEIEGLSEDKKERLRRIYTARLAKIARDNKGAA